MFKFSKIERADKKNNNKTFTLRLPEDIYDEYKKISKETNQSLNSLIIVSLKYTLKNIKETY